MLASRLANTLQPTPAAGGARPAALQRVESPQISRRPARMAAQAAGDAQSAAAARCKQAAAWAAAPLAALLLAAAPPARADAPPVSSVFEKSCAGCHAGGGNIIRRDATLQLGDLQRNGLADEAALYQVIYSGRSSMPGFGLDCTPRGKCTFGPRLTDDEVRELAAYVLANAEAGWPAP